MQVQPFSVVGGPLFSLILAGSGAAAAGAGPDPARVFAVSGGRTVIEAEAGRVDSRRVEVVEEKALSGKKGIALQASAAERSRDRAAPPDVVFTVRAEKAGRYVVRTRAGLTAAGMEIAKKARSKYDSFFLRIAVGAGRPTRRVVYVPWSFPNACVQTLGKFALGGGEEAIRIWLPAGVVLDRLEFFPYVPPKVPAAAAAYRPKVVPPPSHPRIWVNAESLPVIRRNLDRGENAPIWARVRRRAARPFSLRIEPGVEIGSNPRLERAVEAKAFVYLMTGDEARGREAVTLTRDYLEAVEFGNLLDITREIGRAIYTGARVYDWCYGLMSAVERDSIRRNLMRLADDMEIGWPPFRQMIVNGHGDEAQVNRDLLSMAIAIYDEEPLPYQYCAYRILEELVPMRRFEYQSPRHNQGVSYGPYRFGWDMHAAFLFYRMTGRRVFDDNITGVCKFWFYMRTPGAKMLQDGDGGGRVDLGETALLCYAYAGDPVIKGDYKRHGGLRRDSILELLVNDPDLEAADGFDSLPLTLDFGPVLGSMVARTGWNMGANLADVVVEMKGGGYYFGNHQHADAGAFQIYYRGHQAADLGQYHFYGTPYDYNFNKRSVAHCMMLAFDPNETFPGNCLNDGGARFVRHCPTTPHQTRTDPQFAWGKVLAAAFGPDAMRPCYSYFSVDLTSAYSRKITSYVRRFCFLNLDSVEHPAVLIVFDDMTTADPAFRKVWQVNTLGFPEATEDGVRLTNHDLGLIGKVDVRMLRPRPAERRMRILSGKEAFTVAGKYLEPPNPKGPKAHGHRIQFSPAAARSRDVFLTVLSMRDAKTAPLSVGLTESAEAYTLALGADRLVVLGKTGALLDQAFSMAIPGGETAGERQVLFAGLKPGDWSLRAAVQGGPVYNFRVEARRHCAFLLLPPGEYRIRPQSAAGAPFFRPPAACRPRPAPGLAGRVVLDGSVAAVPPLKSAPNGVLLLPAVELARLLGATAAASGADTLRITLGDRRAVFTAGRDRFDLNGYEFALSAAARREAGGRWYVPGDVLAALLNREAVRTPEGDSVVLEPLPPEGAGDLLWVEATDPGNDPAGLHALLAGKRPGRKGYWAIRGRDSGFTLYFRRPVRVAGVGIAWHLGKRRKARFRIDTSADGKTWRSAFEGSSSGASADLERYEFPAREVRALRFRGFGNTMNDWNSLVRFQVLPPPAAP